MHGYDCENDNHSLISNERIRAYVRQGIRFSLLAVCCCPLLFPVASLLPCLILNKWCRIIHFLRRCSDVHCLYWGAGDSVHANVKYFLAYAVFLLLAVREWTCYPFPTPGRGSICAQRSHTGNHLTIKHCLPLNAFATNRNYSATARSRIYATEMARVDGRSRGELHCLSHLPSFAQQHTALAAIRSYALPILW